MAGPEKTTPQHLLRVIVDEFEERGWRYLNGLPARIATQCQERGALDARAAAELADSRFLARNHTDRASLQEALVRAFANRVLKEPPPLMNQNNINITVNGDRNTFGDVTQIGQEIKLSLESPKTEILDAVAGLVRRGLDGQFSKADLDDLAALVETRGDIDQAEIETVVGEVVEAEQPEPGKLATFRKDVLTGATTTLVVQGILAVLGIPFPT
ncbi:MAG TPA: hypothetical protein VN458_00170 [Solirubrobacterales bacterium]|nr:hypothetical protein [Solirubrobacterales bacterium]